MERALTQFFGQFENSPITHNHLTRLDNPLPQHYDELSEIINNYALADTTRGEMLQKTPEQLQLAFQENRSNILVDNDGGVIAHASLDPLVIVNNRSLVEFGGWIVRDDFRHHRINGFTVGEYVGLDLIDRVKPEQATIIATVKRQNSLRGLLKLGFTPISYHDFPFITGSTCVCGNSGDCQHRRRPGYGEINHPSRNTWLNNNFEDLTIPNGDSPRIPCTLLALNLDTLVQIEYDLEKIYHETMGRFAPVTQALTHKDFKDIKNFYEKTGLNQI